MPRKINVEETLEQFKIIHNNKYDYSEVVFVNFDTKIKIICPLHGSFYQRIAHHRKGTGCPECNPKKRLSKDDFSLKVKDLYGDNISFNLSTYKNTQSKVSCECVIHGTFEQYAYNILRGQGCQQCGYNIGSNKRKKSTSDFILESNKIHKNKYDYSLVKYKNANTKVCIVCEKHGMFKQTPNNHIRGRGCPKCGQDKTAISVKSTLIEFVNKATQVHSDKYDYSNIDYYINNKTKVKIICEKHGMFEQQPNAHILGQGCPRCAVKISKSEQDIVNYVMSLGVENIIQNDRNVLDGLEIDILIPDLRIGIEYNGLYFHREGIIEGIGGGKDKTYHLKKTELANQKGYGLIQIFEDEWMFKSDIIKSKLAHLLNKSNNDKIGARHCKIKSIKHSVAKDFLNSYHIQGYDNAKIRYGAFYDNVLVGIMTFTEIKKGSNQWKLNRFATNFNYHVVGLGSKLLKHFEREVMPDKLITFADRRYTLNENNNLYTSIGFTLTNKTEPAYYYIKKGEYVRHNRVGFMKHKLLEQHPQFNKLMTEKEMATEMGFDRVYDCGNFKFEKYYL